MFLFGPASRKKTYITQWIYIYNDKSDKTYIEKIKLTTV